jgi:hypothetical protein
MSNTISFNSAFASPIDFWGPSSIPSLPLCLLPFPTGFQSSEVPWNRYLLQIEPGDRHEVLYVNGPSQWYFPILAGSCHAEAKARCTYSMYYVCTVYPLHHKQDSNKDRAGRERTQVFVNLRLRRSELINGSITTD